MVISGLIRSAAEKIGMRDAQLLFQSALRTDALDLFMQGTRELSREEEHRINSLVSRIEAGEPLQYVTGEQEFMGLVFKVNPSVLIPRSDTETLVEYIIEKSNGAPKILDICTGSGCIGISLANFIEGADVTCTDISAEALKTAEKNAALNGVSIDFIRSDIMTQIPPGCYDTVVSNPPYIETGVIDTLDSTVKDYEPRIALDGGGDGLMFYRRIAALAPRILKRGGMLCFEIGFNQAASVSEIMRGEFTDITVIKDLCGNDRVVSGRLIG